MAAETHAIGGRIGSNKRIVTADSYCIGLYNQKGFTGGIHRRALDVVQICLSPQHMTPRKTFNSHHERSYRRSADELRVAKNLCRSAQDPHRPGSSYRTRS